MPDPHALLSHLFSLTLPQRLTGVSSWHEHLPFACAPVAAALPRVLVGLGTRRSGSSCGFCQVVGGLDATSVSTHMLPLGVSNDLMEIARVLKPGGRRVSTSFLLNAPSRRQAPFEDATVRLPHQATGCRVRNREDPSEAVAHEASRSRVLHRPAGLRISEVTSGSWCGGSDLLAALQDSIIAVTE